MGTSTIAEWRVYRGIAMNRFFNLPLAVQALLAVGVIGLVVVGSISAVLILESL